MLTWRASGIVRKDDLDRAPGNVIALGADPSTEEEEPARKL